jgi:hypothetical protein
METEWITYRQWESYAKRCAHANLKREQTSLTASSIARSAQHLIREIRDDSHTMQVCGDWRAVMRAARPNS